MRIEIIVRAVGQLFQLLRGKVKAENVPDVRVGSRCEKEFRAVIIQFQTGEFPSKFPALPRTRGDRDALQNRDAFRLRLEIPDQDRPAAVAVPGTLGSRLFDNAAVARLFHHADDLLEIEQRIRQGDMAAQAHA